MNGIMKRPQKLPGVKILVVDDEPDLREIISSRFQMEGSHVTLAENGESALKVLAGNDFDAVISDIRMPGGSGIELLEALQAMQSKDIEKILPAVILISGFSDLARKDALARGAAALLVKPFDLDDMITAVWDAVRNKSRRPNNPEGGPHV
jgi:CheY-like chemotaxis protein